MTGKRPYPDDAYGGDHKRSRSNNASPAPPANGAGAKPDISKAIAEARARAAAVKAKLQAQNGGSASPSPSPAPGTPAAASPPAPSAAEAARQKIEQMKARVAAATKKVSNPTPQATEFEDASSRARGGLNIGLHPALLGDAGSGGAKGKQAIQPKFATTMANRRTESPVQKDKKQLDLSGPNLEELKKNPYYDPNVGGATAKGRQSKQLVFNQKGKFIQQANALRRQAALEQMKKRIAEQAKKVGLDEASDKNYLVPAPPEVEWWDEGLVGSDYNLENAKLEGSDSIVTIYVQHPVLLEPPQDRKNPGLKPLPLTKKEQGKLRRQRRMAEHKEQQAKIRLGLEPPPPPKVKKSNLMRVLGEQAVKDPTAVEARVNREIAERAAKHEQDNEARKLTKEQRHEKLAANQEADAAKGIIMCVFKVDNLCFGKHRYQIDVNAKQSKLTGIVILNPKFNLIIVEGGAYSTRFYKKLMLNRIKWHETAMPQSVREGNREAEASWLQSVDENGELKDLSYNKCTLIWEGEERDRAFKKWFGLKVCETDAEAKDALTRSKMENMWTLAKTYQE
ncbi:putative u4 u6 small nuclear ribonucleoprotein [Lasiodiplodia theobromae]|uniref:U4/U6 small nuclear ribonucleoprotein Prp3 n=1 Tax=Lasiodiplodia theobromae TaxID=45133 RepID=A0A5N5DRA1_9PEZI|nr:U4 u6 small nuclear ribonucleo protein [Lasiodiplodia theobromae]KAB2579901.1 U4/U6 small nuclear ribonucleoprotein Prp3 [Lasiodiplodia theobromae]KAF4541022.1 U4 u6 small nuclear ribonucleo protein [Lasiodiplodia theobromae]KAF9634495.1 putative u4 u6 small nuclear ribonucleoprotein [Lasiodiplodia theobromae]